MIYHKSVLIEEVITYLDPQPGKLYVDVTFGGGGHTRAILEKEPDCKVIAFDWDETAINMNAAGLQAEFPGRLTVVWGNFAHMMRILKKKGIHQITGGVLADFGTSQFQLKEKEGFSFATDTRLDMRMSPAHQKTTAEQVVNFATEKELADIFFSYADERYGRRIARGIVEYRAKTRIKTTAQLVDIVKKSKPYKPGMRTNPATKVFQALRIFVNRELENIQSFLSASLAMVVPGGRIVCISFHSLEDRMVKEFFRTHPGVVGRGVKILTPKVVKPTEEEIEQNKSSRSSLLRAAQVCIDGK